MMACSSVDKQCLLPLSSHPRAVGDMVLAGLDCWEDGHKRNMGVAAASHLVQSQHAGHVRPARQGPRCNLLRQAQHPLVRLHNLQHTAASSSLAGYAWMLSAQRKPRKYHTLHQSRERACLVHRSFAQVSATTKAERTLKEGVTCLWASTSSSSASHLSAVAQAERTRLACLLPCR